MSDDQKVTRPLLINGSSIRILLPIVAFVLLLWNALLFLNSWMLLPANDFGRMYASAYLFMQGKDMYAYNAATPAKLGETHEINLYNMNPPHFHVLLLPFTLAPNIDVAFILWWALSALCLWRCLKWSMSELNVRVTDHLRSQVILFAIAFSGTGAMLFTSQLSFILMVPLTLMWLEARRGHWTRAGILLGLALSVKPFLAVVLAYFVLRRHWRGVVSCLTATALCYVAGLAIFGWDNHLSWVAKMAVSDGWAWLPINGSLMGFLTRSFTTSIWFTPVLALMPKTVWLMWISLGGALGLITLAATSRGDSPEGIDHDCALLLWSAVLFCPLGWTYYLWFAVPPCAAILARRWPVLLGERADSGLSRLQMTAVVVTMVFLMWPVTGTRLGQPEIVGVEAGAEWPTPVQGLLTFTVGSVYFWGVLAVWGGIVASCFALKRRNRLQLPRLDAKDYRISVVMPVFSEVDSVRHVATWLVGELRERLEEIIIIQSPKSSPESRAVCHQLTQDYPEIRLKMQQHNPGLGRGVREGLALTRGNLVLMIDSDGEMENGTVPRMLASMAEGNYDMVVASRWLAGGGFEGYSRLKYMLNWTFQQVFRWLFWTPVHDLTYGFKLMRAELAHGITWQGSLHEIACETTLKPIALGVSVGEVPSKWTARTQGVTKNSFWRNFRYVAMAGNIMIYGVPFAKKAEETALDDSGSSSISPLSTSDRELEIPLVLNR